MVFRVKRNASDNRNELDIKQDNDGKHSPFSSPSMYVPESWCPGNLKFVLFRILLQGLFPLFTDIQWNSTILLRCTVNEAFQVKAFKDSFFNKNYQ